MIDDDELRHGMRREGLMSAFFVFIGKVTSGLSLGIAGYVLAAAGYDNSGGTMPEPTDELNRAMRLLCGVLPAVLSVLMLPLLYYHPITHTRQQEINKQVVEQRHAHFSSTSSTPGAVISQPPSTAAASSAVTAGRAGVRGSHSREAGTASQPSAIPYTPATTNTPAICTHSHGITVSWVRSAPGRCAAPTSATVSAPTAAPAHSSAATG